MADTTNLAARLLAFAPTSDVADVLAARSTLTDPVRVAVAPSTKLALSLARRGVKYAASMAGAPVHDPELLAKLGKMPQKTVRRLVAANPDTPIGTLIELSRWALANKDDETLDALCGTLPPPQWLPTMRALRQWDFDGAGGYRPVDSLPGLDAEAVVAQLERRADPEMVWATYRLGMLKLSREIAKAAVHGRLPVAAAELVHETDRNEHAPIIDAIVSDKNVDLDAALVNQIATMVQRRDVVLPEPYQRRLSGARRLNPYAAQMFVFCGEPLLMKCAANSLAYGKTELDDRQIAHLVDAENPHISVILLSYDTARRRLTAEQLAKVATVANPSAQTVKQMLTAFGDELPSAAKVNLLRNGDPEITGTWLTGGFGYVPTADEMRMLASDPGQSVTKAGLKAAPTTVPGLVQVLSDRFHAEHGLDPDLGHVFNEAGPVTLQRAANARVGGYREPENPNGFTAYLARRITEQFGANPQAWETVVKLASEFAVGTVDDFFDVVAAMVEPLAQTA